jgi:hypothetical protein
MQAFTLYGLDENHRAVSVEILKAETLDDELRRLARERLQRFAEVELWTGSRRLLAITRRQRPLI